MIPSNFISILMSLDHKLSNTEDNHQNLKDSHQKQNFTSEEITQVPTRKDFAQGSVN